LNVRLPVAARFQRAATGVKAAYAPFQVLSLPRSAAMTTLATLPSCFASRFFSLLRRHPLWSAAAILLLGGAVGSYFGVRAWERQQVAEAERALEHGDYDEAGRRVDRLLALWPWSRDLDMHLLRVRIDRISGRYKAAEKELNNCKHLLGDTNAAIQLEWLLLRAQRGEVDSLRAGLWRYVTEKRPEAVRVLEALSLTYLSDLRLSAGRRCLEEWLKLEPNNARVHEMLALDMQMLDAPPTEVAKEFVRALELDSSRDEARRRLAELLILTRDAPAARPHLEYLVGKHPDRPEYLVDLAECRQLEGKIGAARQLLSDVVRDHPHNAHALSLLGKIELQDSHPKAAEKWLRLANKEDPSNLQTLHNLYNALLQQPGRAKEASAISDLRTQMSKKIRQLNDMLQEDVDQRPDDPDTAVRVARLAMETGSEQFGLRWLYIALLRDPNHRGAHRALAEYYERKHQPDQAAQHWKMAGMIRAQAP
jgi:predicted Zn-dependent protease